MDTKRLSFMASWAEILVALLLCACAVVVNSNNRWCPIKCNCMNDFETVDCAHRSLSLLPDVSNLTKRIFAESNNITSIASLATLNLTRLVVLDMPNNNITEVTSHTLCSLPRLMEINLASNRIVSFRIGPTSIDSKPECQLTHLQILHLESNKMHMIPRNFSVLAPNLHILNLAYNEIHSTALDSSFAHFSNIQVFDLSGNPIHGIGAQDLDPLGATTLETLSFHDCAMSHVHEDSFQSLSNLTSLSLSKNNLIMSELESAFTRLGEGNRLAMLDIKEGPFTVINSSNLCMFSNLVILDISYSSVSHVEPKLWECLPNLEVLNLQGNFLTALNGAHTLSNLKKLLLRDNKINDINLHGLGQMDVIDLGGNQLRELPADWLTSLEHINVLNVSHNTLSSISHRALQHVSINTLDLSHNHLRTLQHFGSYKVQTMDISHNNVTIVTDNAFDNLEPYLEELDMSFNALTDFFMLLPRDFTALQRLNLAHNYLVDDVKQGRLGTLFQSLSHLQVLDLSYNKISGLASAQMKRLHHLTTLQLEGNRIAHLDELGVQHLPSLAKLMLAHNHLCTVDVAILTNMTYLETVDFSRNPYQCTCDLYPFQLWLNQTFVTVVHLEESDFYQCATPEGLKDRYVLSVKPDLTPCQQHNSHLSLRYVLKLLAVAFVCICVIFVAACLICYYTRICSQVRTLRYKWQVRYREVSSRAADSAVDTLETCDDENTENSFEQIEVADNAVLTLKNDYAEDVEIYVK